MNELAEIEKAATLLYSVANSTETNPRDKDSLLKGYSILSTIARKLKARGVYGPRNRKGVKIKQILESQEV